MKNTRRFFIVTLAILWSLFGGASRPALANGEGGESHGGDGFQVGGAIKSFDVLEHEKEFTPSDLPEYQSLLAPQIQLLKQKLPRVGRYLEQKLVRGIQPRWYFVHYQLKDVPDEGPSNLVLAYNKVQIAINSGRVVQIQEDLFNQLATRDKAYLLMHEAVIAAVGVSLVRDGNEVRSLAALFLHKNLSQFTGQEIADEITALVHAAGSRLQILAGMDTDAPATLVDGSGFEDHSTLDDGTTPTSCLDASDHCVFRESSTGSYWSENFLVQGPRHWREAAQFCAGLKQWGGFSDWRLPYLSELQSATAGDPRKVYENYPGWGELRGPIWSATEVNGDFARAVAFDFQFRSPSNYDKQSATLGFRCVRSDLDHRWMNLSTDRARRYYTSCHTTSDQCVFQQTATGLVWSGALPGAGAGGAVALTYEEAKSACASLNNGWGGGYGWRVPTLGEWRRALADGYGRYLSRFSTEGVGKLNEWFWAVTYQGDIGVSHQAPPETEYDRVSVNPTSSTEQTNHEWVFYPDHGDHRVRHAWVCVYQAAPHAARQK